MVVKAPEVAREVPDKPVEMAALAWAVKMTKTGARAATAARAVEPAMAVRGATVEPCSSCIMPRSRVRISISSSCPRMGMVVIQATPGQVATAARAGIEVASRRTPRPVAAE
jgi:hypothetical protein